MSLPFLLEEDIKPNLELELVNTFKRYFAKTWIDGNQSLSVFYTDVMTNNGAESYHNTLRSYLKINHPNIWKFMSSMYKLFSDYDLEVRRLDDGLQIIRIAKVKTRMNADIRTRHKQNI